MKPLLCALFLLAPALAPAAEPIVLPKPHTTGGKPLMEALALRKSTREYGPEKLSPQVLSDLLWAAFGINRADGRRTAPSANNRQEMEIYAAMADGLYLYNAKDHRLEPVVSEDLRVLTGTQDYVGTAPLNLVYVADLSKLSGPENAMLINAGTSTGLISQNVYLFCASEGLVTVVRASIDKPALAKAMRLRDNQRITLSQTVGYPKR